MARGELVATGVSVPCAPAVDVARGDGAGEIVASAVRVAGALVEVTTGEGWGVASWDSGQPPAGAGMMSFSCPAWPCRLLLPLLPSSSTVIVT